jgi:biotin-dependent carboxylase-like uncharacterized protein
VTGHLDVLATGPLATVQDLGRPGHARWGVSRSGAADRASARLAQRLVGNDESAAGIEVTFGGLVVRPDTDVMVALTGAPCPATVGDDPVGTHVAFTVHAGRELRLGVPVTGLRTYLAVRGGFEVPPVLGSRATDVLGGVGPDALTEGDQLPVGDASRPLPAIDHAAVRTPTAGEVELRVRFGPRHDWFAVEAHETLVARIFTASSDSNRIGVRLDGPPLARVADEELASEGLVRGAIQVPPSGPPTLFLADHPVTGGYPVIAVVVDEDVDLAAQVRPGQHVRFRALTSPALGTSARAAGAVES